MLLGRIVKKSSLWHSGCTALIDLRVVMLLLWMELLKVRAIRRFWQVCQRLPPFFAAVFSMDGLGSAEGRILIWGKARRILLSSVPPLARHLQARYSVAGGCTSCGTSCKILFQCPHWDDNSFLCSVYEDRPNICRLFPITPADIRDRDIVARLNGESTGCGFTFSNRPRNDIE